MAAPLTLRSTYARREPTEPESGWVGTFTLELDVDDERFPPGARLAVWCTMLLDAGPSTNARVVERMAGRIVLEPLDRGVIDEQGQWIMAGLRARFPARHANDGPEAAYVVLPTGAAVDVTVTPAIALDRPASRPQHDPSAPDSGTVSGPGSRTGSGDGRPATVPVVPHPQVVRGVRSDGPPERRMLHLDPSVIDEPDAWRTIRDLAGRLGCGAFDARDRRRLAVLIQRGDGVPPGEYRVELDGDNARLRSGDEAGIRHGLVTLAQWADAGVPAAAAVEDHPAMARRIVHLDLARRWYEPEVVERLVDVAAWRKLGHVHLHLTDDEAWRFPVPEYPTLATVGGTRGHGLPIPPLVGSGAAPYGRAYTADEIGRWVGRADDLGIVLVPEVDVPAHCHAALVAVPELRDPADTSGAHSVQGYVDNVLVPGHPETLPFLESVFGALARLFPSSPWLHIGGDEVPAGAWRGSPIAAAYASRHGLTSTQQIETHFHRQLVAMIHTTTGRDVAMWEEAALSGLEPSGYAVAWTSASAGVRLAEAGHDVVLAPGEAYYLDMAADRDWDQPGSTWAGTVPLEATVEFEPGAGWDARHLDRLLGVQACIWSEHMSSLDVLDQLVFPRLDAVAERGWTGRIVGGEASIRERAARLPRFSVPTGAG